MAMPSLTQSFVFQRLHFMTQLTSQMPTGRLVTQYQYAVTTQD